MCSLPNFPLLEKVARKSFILGISNYNPAHGDSIVLVNLPGVTRDCELMQAALQDAGFEVTKQMDQCFYFGFGVFMYPGNMFHEKRVYKKNP